MINLRLVFTCLLFLAALPAHAATVFGTIYQNGAPVAGASLRVDCPWGSSTASTDQRGSYRLTAGQDGSCTLTVSNAAGAASGPIDFFSEPTKHDFAWTPGNPTLQRR